MFRFKIIRCLYATATRGNAEPQLTAEEPLLVFFSKCAVAAPPPADITSRSAESQLGSKTVCRESQI